MFKNFKMKIENFGIINHADLDISKINIIAGKNSSGKTTISKLLYCFITSFSIDGENLTFESMKDRIDFRINDLFHIFQEDNEILNKITQIRLKLESTNKSQLTIIHEVYEELENLINSIDFENKEILLEMLENDKHLIGIINPSDFYLYLIKNEFSGDEEILNNFNNSQITIYNDLENPFDYSIRITDGIGILSNKKLKNMSFNREAIYIETPYFLDYRIPFAQASIYGQKPYHQFLLYQKLMDQSSKNDILDEFENKKTIEFERKLNSIIEGKFKIDNSGLFKFKQNSKEFSLANTSTGIKTIGMIQILLENRKLHKNSYLIMDEPEVHLHPEWQIKLAEILVLLVKELGVTLFLNSHSPLFIEAMEVYSTKYETKNDTRLFLTEKNKENDKYDIIEIPFKKIYELYDNLGNPYDTLDIIRGENIANNR